jgi:hypothetical protein
VVRVISAVGAPVLIVPESRARFEDEVIAEVATV